MAIRLLVSWLLLIISIYSSFFCHVVVCGQCLRDQQSLLLQLKDTLVFNTTTSKILVQWNQSSDCCTWPGITCDKGRVTGLKLSEEPISGGIENSTIFNLVYLRSLDLSHNFNLYSEIPWRIANLTNLSYLNLSSSGFVGRIPREISSLKRLVILDLSSSDLGQNLLEISNLSMVIQNLTKLEELYLDGVNISAQGNVWGQALSSSLPNLRVLSLSRCQLSGPVDHSLSKLHSLSVIRLDSNNLSAPISGFFANFLNLTFLSLSDCSLYGMFPKEIFQVQTLMILDISYNELVHGSLSEFPIDSDLESLVLTNTSFGGRLPASIGNLRQLSRLYLGDCHFFGTLPNSLMKLTQLVYLDLSSNNFTGPIPMSIFKLRKLEYLSLSLNRFNGTVQLDMIQDLTNIYYLDISHNNLSVNARGSNFSSSPKFRSLLLASCKLGVFPDLIKNQSELSSLDLSNNQIYGEIPNWIWSESLFFLNLSHNHLSGLQEPYSLYNLDTFDLSFNQLHGKIPILPQFASYIDLSNNYFTSSIPSDIGNKLNSSTFYLSLTNNFLTGVIPESMCNASYLEVLDLSSNMLDGRIPLCMLALGTLWVNLRRNNFSGSIPDAFPVTCNLQTLDLNGNLLTGRIPKSLANCSSLEVLNLGNNQMVDTFPLLLKSTSTLRVLILRSNKFYGHIKCPESIGDWPVIQIVSVASNNFSGELPGKCLTKWYEMMAVGSPFGNTSFELDAPSPTAAGFSYEDAVTITNKGLEMELVKIPKGFSSIDFSNNNFHGKIPKELGLFRALIVLNLSNNALSGHIPSSCGNLQQLESLDLSRNHLNGEIPASLSNLNFLSVLDLSYNKLFGRIPKGNQIQTFSADSFQGNEGLCGPPLTQNCTGDVENMQPESPHEARHSNAGSRIKWDLIAAEVGFVVGFGSVIGPLVFSRRWRKRYFDRAEDIAFSILPQLVLKKWLSWKMGSSKKKRQRNGCW